MMSGTDMFTVPIPSPPNPIFPPPDSNPNPNPNSMTKKKRNLPGTPDPDAEVIALSPKTLMATNRFICEICKKGFQRDQNLQLHRRGHNLPWKLKQRPKTDQIRKKVYICPEKTCVHHDPGRALGDLTGIKKHFSRKHGEKKWKCEKCSKRYAVQSDWKAHSKTCGTREYKCDCGTLFSRKDSFITHRAFCDALAEESARFTTTTNSNLLMNPLMQKPRLPLWLDNNPNPNLYMNSNSDMVMVSTNHLFRSGYVNLPSGGLKEEAGGDTDMTDSSLASFYSDIDQTTHFQTKAPPSCPMMSATALLQKAVQMGSTTTPTPTPPSSSAPFFAGMMNSCNSPSSSSTNTLSSFSRSELHQMIVPAPESQKPADALMNFSAAINGGGIHNVDENGTMMGMNLQSGFTRDFLGMGRGDGASGGAFFPPELAKLASMSSAMGLTHFTGGNH